MKVTRRELVCGAGSLAGAFLLGGNVDGAPGRSGSIRRVASPARIETGPLSGARLYEDVIAYYNLGEHRTATQSDLNTSQWLLEQMRGAGLKATFQTFSLRQFFARQTRLAIAEKGIRAVPLWYPRATGPDPVIGTMATLGKPEQSSLRGKLVVVTFPASAGAAVTRVSGHSEIIRAAANAGASAVIAVTESATKEIIALNSPAGADPWPIPVVLVGQRDEPALQSALRAGVSVSLLVDGEENREAIAKNVIARVDRGKELIVVSTPQSGWFRCAGERGPGIALFLGLARWAGRRPAGASFLFVSTSGHEIGEIGMQAFLKDLAPPAQRVLCWIHLGAGIATYSWEETSSGLKRLPEPDSKRYLMTSRDLVPILTTSFAGLSGLTPTLERVVGEFEFILKGGYRAFGIAAGHRFHHTPADSPEMTGPEILEPVGKAVINTVETIERNAKV